MSFKEGLKKHLEQASYLGGTATGKGLEFVGESANLGMDFLHHTVRTGGKVLPKFMDGAGYLTMSILDGVTEIVEPLRNLALNATKGVISGLNIGVSGIRKLGGRFADWVSKKFDKAKAKEALSKKGIETTDEQLLSGEQNNVQMGNTNENGARDLAIDFASLMSQGR